MRAYKIDTQVYYCLGTIYSHDYDNIKVICPAKFLETTEQFTNIFYTSTPKTIQIRCPSGANHMAIQQRKRITLPDNCKVKSRHLITRTGHDFNLESANKTWPATWNVSGLLFDFDSKILATHMASLKLIH